ncbi:MAG TPA: Rrf2 family transcriptional regulator [Blastocatellia bacterium]|nr:Rrf2 family transcriptional regulator [Blastocatellia bacterium]
MAANTRFAVAIHAAGMLTFADRVPITSESIARSVNTNPVVVRRILGLLTQHGLVQAQKGAGGGSMLARPPERISLYDLYRAVEAGPLFQVPSLGDAHECPIGRNVGPVLNEVMRRAERGLIEQLKAVSLADVIGKVHKRVERECRMKTRRQSKEGELCLKKKRKSA